MEEMIRASRAEAGCIDYAYAVDLLDANMLRVIERWESREALQEHFQTPHMARFRSALEAIGPTDVAVRMYESDQEQLPL